MAQRLPVTGSRTLGKNWMKFLHIMRLGKVVREVERSPVQQLEVMFEPDLWKKLDSPQAREALTKVCTDGAPSCTMRLKTPEGKDVQRSGPLFQLTTTVLAPGKGQMSESRHVCFSEGVALLDLLAESGLCSSKGDARRSVEGGGIYLNSVRADDTLARVGPGAFIDGRFLVLRKGKKSYHLVEAVGD